MDALPATSSCLDLTISIAGSSSGGGEGGSGEIGMIDLDINQVPEGEGEDRSWPMITLHTHSSMDLDDQDDDHISNGREESTGPRKKLRLSKDQSRLLEESFQLNHTLNIKQKEELATRLQLKTRQVEVWFQNRRARSKLKQTEIEVEYLKRWFSTLTDQNRWLQKEVEDLRAMKVGPPTVLSPHTRKPLPASTLSMCPRCERVSTTNPTASKPPLLLLGIDRAVSPATKSQTEDTTRQSTSSA